MSSWTSQILSVNSPDPDVRRRGGILIIIALGMAMLALSFMLVSIFGLRARSTLVILSIATVAFLGAAYLGRIGQANLGGYTVIGVTILAIIASALSLRTTPSTPIYLVMVVLLAGVLLPAAQIWSTFAVCTSAVALIFWLLPSELRSDPSWLQTLRATPLVLLMASLIMFISARSVGLALQAAQAARAEAEAANARLGESNASLETRVSERTAELSRVLEQQQLVTRQLEASLAAQRDMNRVIAELSVPIIPISDSSLVVPLVGALDTARTRQLLDSLLGTIAQAHARTVILDVTGVAVVDTQVAAGLLQVAAAARLMGAATVLVGIRPEVAQTLVGLGVDLDAIRTAASLQDGLALISGGRRSA